MNRALFHIFAKDNNANPLHRPARQLRQESESMLKDMAYVLELTRRVKEEILEKEKETIGV